VTAFIGLLALLSAGIHLPTHAQEKREPKKPDYAIPLESTPFPGAANQDFPIEGAATIKFLEARFAFDKLVKGAAYSAVAVTETTQTLSDGNQITRKSEVTLYRDSEGRTRREQTLEGVKTWPAAGDPPRMIFINDPIAGYNYVLDPRTRTARKTGGAGKGKPGDALNNEKAKTLDKLEKAGRKVATKQDPTETGGNAPPVRIAKPPDANSAPDGAKMVRQVKIAPPAEGAKMARLVKPEISIGAKKSESLGKQIIEGIEAEGTRSTTTIPAGEIGNRLAIEIVDERWYSPELQTLMMSKHHDPRSGDTIYRLTNMNRGEPDRSLFEVPLDYTLNDASKPSPARIKKSEDERL
jgi:hypothetical protein